MIYYPLSTLMMAGIRDILIISTPKDTPLFEELLENGNQWGLNIEYAVQANPDGLAQSLIIAENFIGSDEIALILGDNIFFGHELKKLLMSAELHSGGATIFAYHVHDPQRYGVVQFDHERQVTSIEEKPKNPQSNFAVTGLYFYDNSAIEIAKSIKPSDRGELEITEVNNIFLKQNRLNVKVMGRGYAWFDTGTHDSMLDATQFVATLEKRQGQKIACPEEIAYVSNWISKDDLKILSNKYSKNSYGSYLIGLINENRVT